MVNLLLVVHDLFSFFVLKSTGTELDWINPSTIGAQPGGSDTQVQYNNDGSFAF